MIFKKNGRKLQTFEDIITIIVIISIIISLKNSRVKINKSAGFLQGVDDWFLQLSNLRMFVFNIYPVYLSYIKWASKAKSFTNQVVHGAGAYLRFL